MAGKRRASRKTKFKGPRPIAVVGVLGAVLLAGGVAFWSGRHFSGGQASGWDPIATLIGRDSDSAKRSGDHKSAHAERPAPRHVAPVQAAADFPHDDSAPQMSTAQWRSLDQALVSQLERCSHQYNMQGQAFPKVRVIFNLDGSLSADPVPLLSGAHAGASNAADRVVAAVRGCAPFAVPDAFKPFYKEWRTRVIQFTPDAL